MAADCQICAVYVSSMHREHEAEERYQPKAPMDMVATDLFEINGVHYLLVLDVYTGFPWYKHFCKYPDTKMVMEGLHNIFLGYGYPKHNKFEGGPHYRSEFKDYYRRMYMVGNTTSAWNHQSNGEAEKTVFKLWILMKKVVNGNGDFKVAFSRLRDAPMVNGKMSPAHLMFRRTLRFPGLPSLLDGVDKLAVGEEKQGSKVAAKQKRNS